MAVRMVVGVTDRDWFEHLRARPPLGEVNFWSPWLRPFRALRPGELFLFKLKAPVDRIVGGGVFAHAADMPSSLAWEAFGEANGAGLRRDKQDEARATIWMRGRGAAPDEGRA